MPHPTAQSGPSEAAPTDTDPKTWRTLATDQTSGTFKLVLVDQTDKPGNDLLTIRDGAHTGVEVCGTGEELASIARAILAHVHGGPVAVVKRDALAAYVAAYDDLASLAGVVSCACDPAECGECEDPEECAACDLLNDCRTDEGHRCAMPADEQAVKAALEA